MLTSTEENYIKEIYALEQDLKSEVNTNLIAAKLATKASSVTDMLKKLSKKELLAYKKYKGVKLKENGKQIALSVIRKHRLWETFLVNKLNFEWDEVHEIAEQLEHIQSDQLTNRLDKFLDFPKTDPHGDPIPNEEGEYTKIDKTSLSMFNVGDMGVFVSVGDSSGAFLKYLTKNNISIGCKIKIIYKEDFDNSIKIEIDNNQFNISDNVAQNLYLIKQV